MKSYVMCRRSFLFAICEVLLAQTKHTHNCNLGSYHDNIFVNVVFSDVGFVHLGLIDQTCQPSQNDKKKQRKHDVLVIYMFAGFSLCVRRVQ